jgi:hypothetical protein
MAGVTSVRTCQFKKLFTCLPQHIQEIAKRKFELFLVHAPVDASRVRAG